MSNMNTATGFRLIREKKKVFSILIVLFLFSLIFSLPIYAQDNYQEFIQSLEGKEIVEITIEGLSKENEIVLLDYLSMIKVGNPFIFKEIKLFFNNLWNTGMFSDIIIEAELTEEDKVTLKIIFKELPKVANVIIEGAILVPAYTIDSKIVYVQKDKSLKDSDIQKDIKNIIELYKSRGIIGTVVKYRKELTAEGEYNIIFTIIEGKEVYVEKIIINGAEKISENKILTRMITKQSTFYDIEKSYSEDILENDKINIVNLYREFGYLDAEILDMRVEIKNVDETDNIQGYFIEIDIFEGEQYIFTGVEIEGNTVFTNEELMKEVELKEGEPINETSLTVSEQKIFFKYYEKGYLYASIKPIIDKDEENNTATVIISIYEDERAHIESIEIVGSESETYIIDRLFDLEEGEIFSLSDLLSTRENLLNTGYFNAEGTYFQILQGSEPGLFRIVWFVQEERLRSVLFNAKFDLSGGIAISGDLQLVNFMGNGWDLSFKTELSGLDKFTVQSSIGTKWLFHYTPISFKTSVSYSIQNVTINPLYLGLVTTPDGYIGIPYGYDSGSAGIDIDGDGVIDYYDTTPVDLNNDGIIDENDTVQPLDLDGDGIYDSAELFGSGLSYIKQYFGLGVSLGYEFTKGIEAYVKLDTILTVAYNPRFGDSSLVSFGDEHLKQIALSDEQIDMLFGSESTLATELKGGWLFTLGTTLGMNFQFLKIGALSSSGPLPSGGWQANVTLTPYFFSKSFIKYAGNISWYFTLLPWGENEDPGLIFATRLGIELLGPLGEDMISYTSITGGDRVGFDGVSELRGFSGLDRNLRGYGKWIIQMELRGPMPGLEQFIWIIPFFLDWGNVGYNPRGYSLEFSLAQTPLYDPKSGDLAVEYGGYTSGHKVSIGFGLRLINIIPLHIYFAWPFEFTADGFVRITERSNGTIIENPWWPEFVITGYLYF